MFESSFQAYVQEQLEAPSVLHQAMKYALLSGGKRIRPSFTLEASQLVSLPQSIALKCAFAMEIVHGFSLVHDDLPCMDNDDYRRGIPTVHKKFGEAPALLAGDALLSFAHETFLSCLSEVSSDAYFNAAQLFSHSINAMILGQAEELSVNNSDLEELIRIQSLKTTKLFHASILCPILLSGKTKQDSIYQECEKFADSFGFAFQIADDLEDAEQDEKQNAKNILTHLGRAPAIQLAHQKLVSIPISEKFSATKLLISKLK